MMAEEAQQAQPTEGAEAAAEGQGEAAAPKKKKMLLIISIAIAVIGVAVAVGVVFFMGGSEEKKPDETQSAVAAVSIVDVPEFNLSLLSDDPTSQHFIKIKISLELLKATDAEALTKLMPRLQDDWGGFMRQMRMADLQGSANLQRLKEGLLRRANQSLDPVAIKAVYIRELLIQ